MTLGVCLLLFGLGIYVGSCLSELAGSRANRAKEVTVSFTESLSLDHELAREHREREVRRLLESVESKEGW